MSDEILDNFEIEEDRKPDIEEIKKLRILQGLVVVQIIAATIATYLAYNEITSILGTGPIGSAIGIFVFRNAKKLSSQPSVLGRFLYGKFIGFRKIGMVIGLSAPIFSVVWFAVVAVLGLGKTAAHEPIFISLCIYTGALFLAVALLFGAYKLGSPAPKG